MMKRQKSTFRNFIPVAYFSCTLFLMGLFVAFTPSSAMGQSQNTEYYHLIAGSFNDFNSAAQMVKSLKTKGYNPVILFPNETANKYRVSVHHSLNRDDVVTFSKGARKQGGSSFWILTQKDPKAAAQKQIASVSRGQDANLSTSTTGLVSDAHYHVIMGSLQDIQAANRAVEALKKKGYEPYILYTPGETASYRVSVFQGDDREEVDKYFSWLKKSGNKTAWIYEDKSSTSSALNIPVSGAKLAPGTSSTYHFIGGSYKRFEQASEYAEKMKAKGMAPLIMFPEIGISETFRVSLFRSTTKADVAAFKSSAEKSGKAKGWILEQK